MYSSRLLFSTICRCQNSQTLRRLPFLIEQAPSLVSFSTSVVRVAGAKNRRRFADKTDGHVDDEDDDFSSKLTSSLDASETRSHNKQLNANRRRKKREMLEKTFLTDEGVEWRILPENDTNFLKLIADMKNKRKREEMGKILVEGRRLVSEAITAGLKLNGLYFTDEKDLDKLPLMTEESNVFKVSPTRMTAWSDLETPPGIFAIMDKPDFDLIRKRQSPNMVPVTVILDNLRDPGNMGSVIRALAAAGCHKILLMKGCCDPWESKVLRGGMGAHFTIPMYEKVQWEHLRNYLPADFDVYLADSNSFEIMCQAESYKMEVDDVNVEDNKAISYEITDSGREVIVDKDLKSPRKKFSILRLPVLEHYKINFSSKNHIALIMGGETQGPSTAAYHFVHKFNGIRCHVPMVNNVDSLNVATAASIMAFEIRRQFSLKSENDQNE